MSENTKAKVCSRCGKFVLHVSSREGICLDCVRREKGDYRTYLVVREYVKAHPNCKASEVVLKLSVSIEKINQFINEGLLEVVNHPYKNVDPLTSDIWIRTSGSARSQKNTENQAAAVTAEAAGTENRQKTLLPKQGFSYSEK